MKFELTAEKKFDNEQDAYKELELIFFPFEYDVEYCSSWANGIVVIEKIGEYHQVTLKENNDMPFYDYKRVLEEVFGWTLLIDTEEFSDFEVLSPKKAPIHARV